MRLIFVVVLSLTLATPAALQAQAPAPSVGTPQVLPDGTTTGGSGLSKADRAHQKQQKKLARQQAKADKASAKAAKQQHSTGNATAPQP